MATLKPLGVLLALGVVTQGAWPRVVEAQDSVARRLPDSTLLRIMGCGTHGPVLQRQTGTRDVLQALGKVSECPEGPDVIAGLWSRVSGADRLYLSNLAGVSSIKHRAIAAALVSTLSDRGRPTAVRLQVLGMFLQQLTAEYGSEITFGTSREARFDASGTRIIGWDTVRTANLSWIAGEHSQPVPIDPTLRVEIVSAINRIAADSSDAADMRLAAREVASALLRHRR